MRVTMTTEQQISAERPSADDIRAELDRIAVSEIFQSSPQLVSFLRFVVESTLHGKKDRIKAYTIGVEVLRRDIKFDPQIDPIVRVEATRLRRTIERYYAATGANDPVIIDLPRGSYIPTFRYKDIPRVVPAVSTDPFELLLVSDTAPVPSLMTPANVEFAALNVDRFAAAPLSVMTPALAPVRLLASAERPLRSSVAAVAPEPTVSPP